ncbi:MAG TPA: hypothetical protein PKW42_08535, partial [bacterium]|nr:hypothetical protein [bacterium]
GRPAVARCKQCGRGLCSQCRIVTEQGIFCSDKCAQTFAVFVQRLKEAEERQAAGRRSSRWEQWVFVLILLAVVFFLVKKFFF